MLYAQPRVAYHDAVQFLALYKEYQMKPGAPKIEVDANVLKILRQYYNASDMAAVIANNVYLDSYFSTGGAESLRSSALLKSFSQGISTMGGLDATKFADGLAKVLVEHAKQELNIFFFDRFNQFLNDPIYGNDLKSLFPETHSIMQLAKDEIYNYQQYLQGLREAFAHDLATLLSNTNKWINKPQGYSTLVNAIQGFAYYPHLQFALEFATQAQQGVHPGDILMSLQNKEYTTKIHPDLQSLLKITNVISQSLRSETRQILDR
jgi:hypothetical protein